jgi:hypothetical protein
MGLPGVTSTRAWYQLEPFLIPPPSTYAPRGLSDVLARAPSFPETGLGSGGLTAAEAAREVLGGVDPAACCQAASVVARRSSLPVPSRPSEEVCARGAPRPHRLVRQGLASPLHTPLVSFLTTSAARSARRAAGLLHPAADHGVQRVFASADQPPPRRGGSIPRRRGADLLVRVLPLPCALRSLPPAHSRPRSTSSPVLRPVPPWSRSRPTSPPPAPPLPLARCSALPGGVHSRASLLVVGRLPPPSPAPDPREGFGPPTA